MSLRGRTVGMGNANKNLINISKILFYLSQLESHGVDLLQFLLYHIIAQTSSLFLSFHKLSASPSHIPQWLISPGPGCLCLTVVLLPIGWDDQVEPSYLDNVTPGSCNTLCLLHIRDTPRSHVGPTYTKLALCFIHLAAKTHKLNLVSSNSSGNINIKISLIHSTNVKLCFLYALSSTSVSSVSGDHLQP